jgi:iron complex outermembrane receptor protein
LLDGRLGQFAIHADGFDRHAGNYDIPDGTQPNSFFKGDGYSFGSSYFFGDNRVGAGVVHYDSTYGIPSDTTFIDMRQTKGMLRTSFAVGAGPFQTLTVDGGYGDYQHQEKDPDTGEVLSTFKDKEWDTRAEALFDKIGPFTGTAVGVQLLHKDFSALGEGADYLLPTTTKSAAAFLFTEAPLTRTLRLQAGARVEHVTIDGSPAVDVAVSRGFTPISASAGLVFDASEIVRLGLTVSSAARAPGQTELFAHGPHDGPATFETGDPGLRTERANSLEGSIRVRTETVRFDGSIWGAKFNHYIYGQLTGRTCDDEGACVDDDAQDLRELNYTQRDATFYGAEAKSTVGLYSGSSGKLEGLVLADYVRATLNGGDNVPRIPPFHIGTGMSWSRGPLDAGFLVKYTARQRDVAFAETETAGFVSLDAQVGWRPVTDQNFEVTLAGHNLTDSVQRNAVALNKDAVILPGRDVRLMARFAF